MYKDFYSEYYKIEDTHWWFVGRRAIFLSTLDGIFGVERKEDRRILDIGCGTGSMLKYLERYGNPQGADADEEAVKFCKQRGVENVTLLKGDRLPFETDHFDLVTMFDVLEHIDDDISFLKEAQRVLKPGGVLLLSVPAYRFLWGNQDEISFHKRRYVASDLKNRLHAAGLAIQRVSYFNTLLFPQIAAVRLFHRLTGNDKNMVSDFTLNKPGLMNDLLSRVFSLESRILRAINFPFGVSIFGLTRKKNDISV